MDIYEYKKTLNTVQQHVMNAVLGRAASSKGSRAATKGYRELFLKYCPAYFTEQDLELFKAGFEPNWCDIDINWEEMFEYYINIVRPKMFASNPVAIVFNWLGKTLNWDIGLTNLIFGLNLQKGMSDEEEKVVMKAIYTACICAYSYKDFE